MIELLSPAGSMEALRAAVQNGANAVYLGYDQFNARMNAKNFSADELQEAIVYCHVRGVAVHLTLNTLVADREMARAADVIRLAATLGVDAFIVQDIGMVQLCREIAPNVAVHASTQMSIHSLEGVVAAAELGCSRVVLSRELPREEIAAICRRSPIEIEVFVHGALCMCYSGQCYLSGVIGRRSGNRGQCAQPCRLPYGYGRFDQNRYPLSLKDNCLIEYLRDLERMGVASLKIEGRMKRPEYVAVVTKAYRAALNGKRVTQADMEELERVFSRQGFTQGYYLGQKGPEMFGTRQEGEDAKELFAAARATYENGEAQLVPVYFYAMLQAGRPAQLAVQDDLGNVCKTVGPEPEPAVYHALTREDLESRLAKTGGTPYRCASVKTALGGDVQLPASAINAMRRDVLAQLTAQNAVLRGLDLVDDLVRFDLKKRLAGGDGVALLLEPCAENAALHLRTQLRHFYVLFHSFSLSAANAASIFCLVFTSASPSARRGAPAQAHGRSRRSRPGQGVRRSEAPARRRRRGWEREFARRRQCPSGRGRIR